MTTVYSSSSTTISSSFPTSISASAAFFSSSNLCLSCSACNAAAAAASLNPAGTGFTRFLTPRRSQSASVWGLVYQHAVEGFQVEISVVTGGRSADQDLRGALSAPSPLAGAVLTKFCTSFTGRSPSAPTFALTHATLSSMSLLACSNSGNGIGWWDVEREGCRARTMPSQCGSK